MKPIKIKLCDSVSLTAIKTDKFKTGMISFSLALPMKKEISAYNKLLCGILRRGSSAFPSMSDLNRRLDELYASSVEIKNSRLGKNDLLVFSAEMLDNTFVTDNTDILDGVVQLLADMILHPLLENGVFPEKSLSKEKINSQDSIRAAINNPKLYAMIKCSDMLRADDPDFPDVENLFNIVSNTDPKTLHDHYEKLLTKASLNVFYIGSEDTERVSDIIKLHFSDFHGIQAPLTPIKPEKFVKLKDVTEAFEASQGKLCLGFRSNVVLSDGDKYFATVLFNEILGGSPASKLFMNVREKLGLCYYCSSSYDSYSGNITVSSGINVDAVECAKREILRQLDDIKKGNISDTELVAAKLSITHWYRQMYDYPSDLFSFYSSRSMLGIDAYPEDYLKKFDSVTKEQITEIANGVILDTVFFLKGTLNSQDNEEEYE